jgi:hypothetical protein
MQPITIKLLTTDKSFTAWKTGKAKLKKVEQALRSMMNVGVVSIDIEYRDIVPVVTNLGRIPHEWMDSISHPEKLKGFDFVALHMSDAQRKRWGIKPTNRGVSHIDLDFVSECYFWADEDTLRGRFNQFEQVFAHELRHLIKEGTGGPDDTHALHGQSGNILKEFSQLDFSKFQHGRRNIEKQRSLMQKNIGFISTVISQLTARAPQDRLLAAARSYIGRDASPRDLAPDQLGCAESVSMIIKDVLPDFPIITGTWVLRDRLDKDVRFKKVTVPMPGDIIISPTGTVAKAPFPGHVGILGADTTVMSNDSRAGKWEANYTIASWQKRWGTAGFPVQFYSLIKHS